MSKLKKASAFGVCLVSVIVGLVYDSENRSSGIIISENGARETGDEEGCRTNAYQCAAKEWTFGIGAATTGGANVIIGKTYTNEEAQLKIYEIYLHIYKKMSNLHAQN